MKRIITLLILAIVTTGGAYYLAVERNKDDVSQTHLLLGGLSEGGTKLTRIVIENTDGVLFSASLADEQWLTSHLDTVLTFPADVDALSEFVSSLTAARIVEPKTAKASQYPKLGVEPVTQPGAQSTLITLVSDTQQWRVLVGNMASSGIGSYVREPSQQRSYLIDKNVQLPLTFYEWLKPDVIDIGLNDLSRIMIDKDETFTIVKTPEGEWELNDNRLPLAYPGVLAHTLNDIVNFEYEKVAVLVTEPASSDHVRLIQLQNPAGESLNINLYHQNEQQDGYLLTLHGELASPEIKDWMFYLSDFQARGLLTLRSELLQQPE